MPYDATKDPLAATAGAPGSISGCRNGAVVTPSNTVDLPVYAKAIRVGGDGDVKFLPVSNDDATPLTVNLAAGDVFDLFQIRRVFATGTTATPIIAGWN